MMARLTTLALAAILITSGCGGWNTDPWRPGVAKLSGQLTGSFRAESTWVSVLGDPEHAVEVDQEGFFELKNVPSGEIVLVASDGEDAAARMELLLYTDRDRVVALSMEDSVRIDGQVLLSDGDVLWATVTFPELPLEPAEVTGSQGRFDLRGVPPGLLDLVIEHPAYAPYLHRLDSVPGERVTLTAILGPTATGSKGSCESCESGEDCASGLCVEEEGSSGGATCAVLCVDDLDCPSAHACKSLEGSQARICRPKEVSCEAIRATVESRNCSGDGGCGESGVCLDGVCTLECSDDDGCPGGGSCLPHATEPINACE